MSSNEIDSIELEKMEKALSKYIRSMLLKAELVKNIALFCNVFLVFMIIREWFFIMNHPLLTLIGIIILFNVLARAKKRMFNDPGWNYKYIDYSRFKNDSSDPFAWIRFTMEDVDRFYDAWAKYAKNMIIGMFVYFVIIFTLKYTAIFLLSNGIV